MKNVSVRTDKGPVDYVNGFLGQMKRGEQMNNMSKFEGYSRFVTWFVALLLVALAAGGGGGRVQCQQAVGH